MAPAFFHRVAKKALSQIILPRDSRPEKSFTEVTWCIDDVVISEKEIQISGWVVSPQKSDFTFLINGTEFPSIKKNLPRPDIGRIYWWLPHAVYSGFRCTAPITNETFKDCHAVFSL